MEVAKERLSTVVALDAIKLGVQGVSQLTSAAASIERVGSTIEQGPILADEALPRLLISGCALPCEFDVCRVGRFHWSAEALPHHHYRWPSTSARGVPTR